MGFELIYWIYIWAVITFWWVLIWKNVEVWEKLPFFLSDMARLGICNMGGYGRIGV